ncbi:hypothetical protein [Hymenobacter negativus]|uniref:TonB-dependent receptor plug domain-containing protein n=1 Tax=Hymenobacter negativus TaxID=2795026 RepID=A0ABS3Q874_9BACT|nr:hypothetical protein [Hymenobacter negativus]MBO2007444.1 hypothetical protein [Hymenobacter negativus]
MQLKIKYMLALASLDEVLFCGYTQAQSVEITRIVLKPIGVLNDELHNNLERRKMKEANRAPIFSTKTVLYVIDGKAIWTDVVPLIHPTHITRIIILKDSAATALYGSKGADGAIIITTKRFPAKYINRLFTKKDHLD